MLAVEVEINGKLHSVMSNYTLDQLVVKNGFNDPKYPVVVAINGVHIPRSELATKMINAGDKIEILSVRQGG